MVYSSVSLLLDVTNEMEWKYSWNTTYTLDKACFCSHPLYPNVYLIIADKDMVKISDNKKSPYNLISFCFMYFKVMQSQTYKLTIVVSS